MSEFDQQLIRIKQEIRDLKTAQTTQSNSKASIATANIPQTVYAGSNTWTIQFEASDDESEPLTDIPNIAYYRLAILEFDEATNTQKIQMFLREDWQRTMAEDFLIISSRPIASVTRDF